MQEQSYQLVVDGVPYLVKTVPFSFNEGIRYSVSYNGSPEFIFAYDDQVGQYVSIGDDAETIPTNLEEEIARRLQSANV